VRVIGPLPPVTGRSTLVTMTIRWGRLRRHGDSSKQAAATGADEHGSASVKRREQMEAQLQARRELSGGVCRDPRLPGANLPSGPGW